MKGSGKQVQKESLWCKIHPNNDPWDELSWLEPGANNTKFVGSIPIWAIYLKSWTLWSLWVLSNLEYSVNLWKCGGHPEGTEVLAGLPAAAYIRN